MDWFLYDRDLCQKRVEISFIHIPRDKAFALLCFCASWSAPVRYRGFLRFQVHHPLNVITLIVAVILGDI